MKLIIAPIILKRLKKRYFLKLTETIKEGWVDDRDIEAIEFLKNNAWKDVKKPFVISYNYQFLKKQAIDIFFNISKIYTNSETINFEFSIQKIVEALYLLFEDIHKDLKELKLYGFLEKLPLSLFFRVKSFNKFIKIFTKHRVMKVFQKYRITAKLLRILLMPIIGVPILFTQLIFSLLYSTLLEGYMRFIYGLILIKAGYYAIYLYSERNSSLHNRIGFNHKEIVTRGSKIESNHTIFNDRDVKSDFLSNALSSFKEELNRLNIIPGKELGRDSDRLNTMIKRFKFSIKNTVKRELGDISSNGFKIDELKTLTNVIGCSYFPTSKEPILQLRAKEFIELGYFLTNISLKTIYQVPGLKTALDKIPLKFIIKLNTYLDDKKIKKHLPNIIKGQKAISDARKYYMASKVFLKRANPITFAVSIVTPLIFQQIQDSFKEYIYNIYGLLLIDSYEATILKDDNCKITEMQ